MSEPTQNHQGRQTGSAMRRHHDQRETLIGLGLNKIGRTRDLPDTPMTRGMIHKVRHIVRVVESDESQGEAAMKLNEIADRARLAQEAHPHRPRHRFGQRQDRRPRRQGPDRALGRAHQGLRGRPDAVAPPAAQARVQQRLPLESTRSTSAGCRRRSTPSSWTRPPRSMPPRWSRPGLRRAKDGMRLLGNGELKAKLNIEVTAPPNRPSPRSKRPAARSRSWRHQKT